MSRERLPFVAGVIAAGTLAVAGMACGTEASGPKVGQGGNGGNTEPVATRTLAPTETISIPEPIATIASEEKATPKYDELKGIVLSAAIDSENSTQIRLFLEDGFNQVDLAESDPNYINSAVN